MWVWECECVSVYGFEQEKDSMCFPYIMKRNSLAKNMEMICVLILLFTIFICSVNGAVGFLLLLSDSSMQQPCSVIVNNELG